MKKLIKRLVIGGAALSVIVATFWVGSNSITASAERKITHPFNTSQYNENPEPTFKSNTEKTSKDLVTKDFIAQKVGKEQVKTPKSSVQKIELTTWGKHVAADEPNTSDKHYMIDPNRQVYVVTTLYPDGLDTKAGFYANATLKTVYDAETGQYFESAVTGDYQGGGIQPMKPSISHMIPVRIKRASQPPCWETRTGIRSVLPGTGPRDSNSTKPM